MKRILIIEVNWLGDILFTTPAIRAIRQSNPNSFIGCLVVPRCTDMLRDNPNIDELIILDEAGAHRRLWGKIALIWELRKKRFDTVISFHRSMSRILIVALAGISRRVGYCTKKRSWLLTDRVAQPSRGLHRVEYFLKLTRSVGMDTGARNYDFYISETHVSGGDKILRNIGITEGEDFFVINPGANWPPKRWSREKFTGLCELLKKRYGKKIVITGAKKDTSLGQHIIDMSGSSAVSICGGTTLGELAAVMRRASLVISNDSGPMHIAVSQGVPTIALFGPTSPEITGPYGDSEYIVISRWDDCKLPCYDSECNRYRCMEAISVDEVLGAVEKLLSRQD